MTSIVGRFHRGHDLEDAVAEAFERIVRGIEDIAEAANPLGYISAVARHSAIASRRKAARREAHESVIEATPFDDDGAPRLVEPATPATQESIAMSRDADKEMTRLSQGLTQEEARLLRLKACDDLSYDEISYVVGRPVVALRVAIHRIIARMRGQVDADVRDAVLEDERCFAMLGEFNLMPGVGGEAEDGFAPGIVEKLALYVEDEGLLGHEDRRLVEESLAASSELREKEILMAKALKSHQRDVAGHSAPECMPAPLLQRLMRLVASSRPGGAPVAGARSGDE